MMVTLTITAKGRMTLGRDILRHIDVEAGGKVVVNKLPDGRIEPRVQRSAGLISATFDFLKREHGPALSIEEIAAITAEGWAGKP